VTARYNRRIYTIRSFRAAIDDALAHMDDFRAARRAGRVSKAFSERVMLAVTQVNGCRYCSYFHTRVALTAGLPAEDIRALLEGDMSRAPADELPALMFAQHYAESGGVQPEDEAWRRLVEVYGPEMARDIVSHIRMISMGNLLGNTFDALLSRLKGRPAEGSSLWQELGVLLGAAVITPARAIRWRMHARVSRR
jgi:AhpD family alkylhydroperoxidase